MTGHATRHTARWGLARAAKRRCPSTPRATTRPLLQTERPPEQGMRVGTILVTPHSAVMVTMLAELETSMS